MTFDTSNIGKLGFGCMRFIGREDDSIDIADTCEMIDRFMKAGGNYFDTAWAYPNSEKTLHEALVERYPRDAYMIASKCVAWTHCTSRADLERQLDETLDTLGVGYLDVYLMHNLGGLRTQKFLDFEAWDVLKKAKADGRVKHIGFSTHGSPEELAQCLELFPETEVVQLQVNYCDWENSSYRERELVDVARARGIPIVVMEPVKGGLLADPPAAVKKIIDAKLPDDTYATAALRFAASVEGVACVLSGMNTIEMVEENCARFENFSPLNDAEAETFEKIQLAMRGDETVPCTGCNYCAKVCPQDVGISGSLSALNYFINYEDPRKANGQLWAIVFFKEGKKMPTECIECGACESACPQNIPIIECLQRVKTEIMPFKPNQNVLIRL